MKGLVADWGEVLAVAAAAAIGLVLRSPGRVAVDRGAITAVLVILVGSAAISIPGRALTGVGARLAGLPAPAVAGLLALPALALAASRLAPEGPIRLGVLALGVAPAELATIALAGAAGSSSVVTAALLVLVSSATTSLAAAPVLTALAGAGAVDRGALLASLVVAVILPLAGGMLIGRRWPKAQTRSQPVATGAVLVLVALVATQVEIGGSLGPLLLAVGVFLAGGVALGLTVAGFAPASDHLAVTLSLSMRDFAIASGIATAAFGPAAAAPAGVYGVLVMVWGSALAARRRHAAPASR